MRKLYRLAVMKCVRKEMLKTRAALNISQAEMSERLGISPRAYRNIEAGKSCCGLATMLFYLNRCCFDKEAFLKEMWHALESVNSDTV